MRNTASCAAVCAKPHAAVKIEYSSTLSISARVRPRAIGEHAEREPAGRRREQHQRLDPAGRPSASSCSDAISGGSTSA